MDLRHIVFYGELLKSIYFIFVSPALFAYLVSLLFHGDELLLSDVDLLLELREFVVEIFVLFGFLLELVREFSYIAFQLIFEVDQLLQVIFHLIDR